MTLFFEAEALAMDERPDCAIAHDNANLGEFGGQGSQRKIWNSFETSQNESALSCKKNRTLATHGLCRRTACGSRALRPLHNTCDTHIKERCDGAAALAAFDGRNNPFP
jgi:hypothetical protein